MLARTLKRTRTFDTVEAMFQNFANKPPYKSWRKEILRDYCERGTFVDAAGKRALKCHPEVEAEIYATARNFDGLGLHHAVQRAAAGAIRRAQRCARVGARTASRP